MNPQDNSKLKLFSIDNKAELNQEASQVRAKLFHLWRSEWQDIYKNLGSSKIPGLPDFQAYDLVNCVTIESEVIAMSGHKFYNLSDPEAQESEFLQSLGQSYLKQIQHFGAERLMTFESLLVNPEFRKSKSSLPLSKIMICIGNALFSASNADAMIAAARVDLKVFRTAREFGFEMLETAKKFRVFDCDLIVQKNRNLYFPQDPAWQIAHRVWQNRESCGSSTQTTKEFERHSGFDKIA